MSQQKFLRLYIILGIISWLIMLAGDLMTVYSLNSHSFDFTFPARLTNLFLSLFFLFTFLTFKIQVTYSKASNFIENLWRVFIIGGATIIISLFIKFLLYLIDESALSKSLVLTNFIYHLNIGLIAVFLANAFFVWKKMILYQKSTRLNIAWDVFEYLALLSILTNFFAFDIFNVKVYIYCLPLFIFTLVLSFNLKWVAFLNYKQKWQSILLIVLIIIISSTFLQQIFDQHFGKLLIIDLAHNIFILGVFCFLLINCFSSMLVLFFNLPTSSVFEQKFGEVMIFQKLSQSIQLGNKEEEVYEILLDSSLSTVIADAGWLEILEEKGHYKAFINKDISEIDIFEIKKVLRKNNINTLNEPYYSKNIRSLNHSERLSVVPHKSLLVMPLSSRDKKLGSLILLKNIEDGFDKDMVDIIYTFVSQASIAINNFRLISEAVENERYKEELKIAKEVQKSLFPQSLIFNINLQISAFFTTAEEVGGDYYDYFQISPTRTALVIGDVSGNGTSAAFNMAQMKGIFQSVIQMGLSPDKFMEISNNALAQCLPKSSFITLSLFFIDSERKKVEYARAGHCPALYYNSIEKKSNYLHSKGMGLGIIRNNQYLKHIEKKEITYNSGDILILYTDGVVEAKNQYNEEFGYERLLEIVNLNSDMSSRQLNDFIVEEIYNFTGTKELGDDCTFLVIKFS